WTSGLMKDGPPRPAILLTRTYPSRRMEMVYLVGADFAADMGQAPARASRGWCPPDASWTSRVAATSCSLDRPGLVCHIPAWAAVQGRASRDGQAVGGRPFTPTSHTPIAPVW